jgi:DNA-binding transcriptional regulator PaaX
MGSKFSSLALHTADRLAETLTDTLLFLFFTYGASFGKRGSRGIYQMFEEAESDIGDINYQSIKHAIGNLVQRDLIVRSPKRSTLEVEITRLGKQRIESVFPTYHEKRPWDGHVYLISYDIPNKSTAVRNLLREYIRRTGGACLQESLWLNPYNPTDLLEEFTHTHHIDDTLLISKLGRDGAIGKHSLHQLIDHVYHLHDLNARYRTFLSKYKHTSTFSPLTLTLDYFSVLKDDPQLPFKLLPSGFSAHEANKLFLRLTKK